MNIFKTKNNKYGFISDFYVKIALSENDFSAWLIDDHKEYVRGKRKKVGLKDLDGIHDIDINKFLADNISLVWKWKYPVYKPGDYLKGKRNIKKKRIKKPNYKSK